MRRWSMPTSPNSLISTAVSARSGLVRRRLSSDVLPAPRKPVRMFVVTGADGATVILPTPFAGLTPRPYSKFHAGYGAPRAGSRLPPPLRGRDGERGHRQRFHRSKRTHGPLL